MMTRSTNQTISLYSEFSSREELLAFANAVDESWDRHKPIKSKPEKRNPRKIEVILDLVLLGLTL